MPLIKKARQKAFEHNLKAEMSAGKPQKQSLAIAYSVQRDSKKKKMAEGGEVKDPAAKTMREHMSWPSSPIKDEPITPTRAPVKIDVPAGEPIKMAKGGDVDSHYDSIADAILRKKKMAEGGEVEAAEEPSFEDLNAEAEEFEDAVEEGSIADRIMKKRR